MTASGSGASAAVIEIVATLLTVKLLCQCRVWSEYFGNPNDCNQSILLKNSKFQDERNRRGCRLNGQCKEWDIRESIYRGRGSNLVGSIWSTLTEKLDGL
jgi:hypothetical protein